MPARWGLGPVFAFEWLTAARRWQMYALRALFVAVLFAAVLIVWFAKAESIVRAAGPTDRNAYAQAGEALFYAFFGTLLSVTLLVAPGATAGAVCLDKARGTLLHLLVTDLSGAEIVLGKLAVRLIPVLGLVAASAPVLSLCLWLGGIDPEAMLVAYAVTLGLAVFGSALAFLLSVWGRKTHEVLLATYLFEVLLLLAYPIALALDALWKQTWLSPYAAWTNPFILAYSPYLYRGAADPTDLTIFLSFCAGGAGVCALLALLTIRRVTVRQSSQPQRRRRRGWLDRMHLPRLLAPRLDRNPVLWREWHRQRPSWWVQLVWAIYALGAGAATAVLIFRSLFYQANPSQAAITSAFQVSIGLLLASVAAVTSLSEERARGSLDVLLTTPLPTRTIVWGKWRGAFRLAPWLVLLPVVNVVAIARSDTLWTALLLMIGLVLAYGAAVTSLGLACATWVRRQGRAVAASVTVYALVAVGWLALVSVLSHGTYQDALAAASPFFGPGQLSFEVGSSYRRTPSGEPACYGYLSFWTVFYGLVALLLYLAVLGTFNRCLGRMSGFATIPRRYRGPSEATGGRAARHTATAG